MRDQQSSIFFSIGQKGTWEPASGLCRIVFEETEYHKKKRKKRKPWPKSGLLPLITNQNPVCQRLFRPTLNKNRKGKSQENQKPKTHKSRKKKPPKELIPKGSPIWSMITHVIFDFWLGNGRKWACYRPLKVRQYNASYSRNSV